MSLYFIGGASASGKSTIARILATKSHRSAIELDAYYDLLEPLTRNHRALEQATTQVSLELVRQMLKLGAKGIVEGGWIAPAQARQLHRESEGHFYPVYCGYPQAKAKSRLALIRAQQQHWLADKPNSEALEFLRQQIKDSRWYQQECTKYALPFFDFSEVASGAAALERDYCAWLQATGPLIPPLAP